MLALVFREPRLGVGEEAAVGLVQVHLRVAQGHAVHVLEERVVVLVQSRRRQRLLGLCVRHAEPGLVGCDAGLQHEVVHEAHTTDGAVDQVRLLLGGVHAVLDGLASCDGRRAHLRP